MTIKLDILEEILAMKRGFGSPEEEMCMQLHLDPIKGMTKDGFGNRILVIGAEPTTAFSCHTDTVHRNKGHQVVWVDQNKGLYFKDDKECLGADDGAGIWLLLNLIANEVPGVYLFHRGEERGGLGSGYIRRETPEVLKGIQRAIAFDRRGQHDIITSQSCGKCASSEFALALGTAIGMEHKGSSLGSFTDTAQYTHLVPECTNVSVGYEREHTGNETLDYKYLLKLRDALLKVDFEGLPTVRDVTDSGFEFNRWGHGRGGYNGGRQYYPPKRDRGGKQGTRGNRNKQGKGHQDQHGTRDYNSFGSAFQDDYLEELDDPFYQTLQSKGQKLTWADAMSIVVNRPQLAANLLVEMDITHTDVINAEIDIAREYDLTFRGV